MSDPQPPPNASSPDWTDTIRRYYRSGAANQFIVFGNIHDQFSLEGGRHGSVHEALLELLRAFDVILAYKADRGIVVEKGGEKVTGAKNLASSTPDDCIPELAATVRRLVYRKIDGSEKTRAESAVKVAVIIHGAEKIAPAAAARNINYSLAHLVATLRAWSTEDLYRDYPLVSFLLADNLTELHPTLTANNRAVPIRVDLPDERDIESRLNASAEVHRKALEGVDRAQLARGLRGVTLDTIEQEIRLAHHAGEPLNLSRIGDIKKRLIEKEAGDLLEFVPPKRTLTDLEGLEEVKALIRTHLRMWREGDTRKFPKGYMLNGPVGTGKTFLAECIAGEGGIPVVKMKNFRNMWYGGTEGNLERIFRIIRALSPCIVFVDEADQALGKRDNHANDGGLSGRIYKMMAEEMSDPATRGQILWVLATSRPDLVEVDLKRPGRIDVKFVLMPTGKPEEAAKLLRALMKRVELALSDEEAAALLPLMPVWLTPGAAEAITSDLYTEMSEARAQNRATTVAAELRRILEHYQPPVHLSIMEAQIRIAVNEATKMTLVPEEFRRFRSD